MAVISSRPTSSVAQYQRRPATKEDLSKIKSHNIILKMSRFQLKKPLILMTGKSQLDKKELIHANIKIPKMFELSDKDFKIAILKMLQ